MWKCGTPIPQLFWFRGNKREADFARRKEETPNLGVDGYSSRRRLRGARLHGDCRVRLPAPPSRAPSSDGAKIGAGCPAGEDSRAARRGRGGRGRMSWCRRRTRRHRNPECAVCVSPSEQLKNGIQNKARVRQTACLLVASTYKACAAVLVPLFALRLPCAVAAAAQTGGQERLRLAAWPRPRGAPVPSARKPRSCRPLLDLAPRRPQWAVALSSM